MTFFNRKEDVLDIQMTQYGKYLLSKGVFRPVYYAFFDDDILYDGQYGGVTEAQNEIEDRIKETPRLRTQYVFHGIETELKRSIDYQRLRAAENDALDRNLPDITAPQAQPELHYTNTAPLGSTALGVEDAARWKINFLAGNFPSVVSQITSSGMPNVRIPQLEVEVKYKTEIIRQRPGDPLGDEADELGDEFQEDVLAGEFGARVSYPDDTVIVLKPDQFVLEVAEENGFFLNDSFELEIYEIDEDEETGKENLIALSFPRSQQEFEITADNMYRPRDVEAPESVDPTNVDYFFNIQVDSEISTELLCKLKPEDKTKGIFSKRLIECTDTQRPVGRNIYGVEEEYEDPCE